MFLVLSDPDQLVRGKDLDPSFRYPDPEADPDPLVRGTDPDPDSDRIRILPFSHKGVEWT
jgi:hypothetical protein